MNPGAALAAWLADPERQLRSLARIEAFTRAWAREPKLVALRAELAALEPKSAEEVLAAAERLLADTAGVEALLDRLITAASADPFFRPGLPQASSEVSSGLLLFDDPALIISAGVTSVDAIAAKNGGTRGASSISFTGHLSSFHFLNAGNATLSFWEAPPIGGDFSARRAGRCRLVARRQVADREVIVCDGRRESFVIEHAEADLVHLHALVRTDAAPLAAEYDSRTHAFVGASTTDEASSRTQLMISLLRLMDRSDALPLVEQSLNSPHFYTRWHVMREYLAMDAEAALPSLRRMAEQDPHPDVRAAARQTLDAFFAHEEDVECLA